MLGFQVYQFDPSSLVNLILSVASIKPTCIVLRLPSNKTQHHLGHKVGGDVIKFYMATTARQDVAALVLRDGNASELHKLIDAKGLRSDRRRPIALTPANREKVFAEEEVASAFEKCDGFKQNLLERHGSLDMAPESDREGYNELHLAARYAYKRWHRFYLQVQLAEYDEAQNRLAAEPVPALQPEPDVQPGVSENRPTIDESQAALMVDNMPSGDDFDMQAFQRDLEDVDFEDSEVIQDYLGDFSILDDPVLLRQIVLNVEQDTAQLSETDREAACASFAESLEDTPVVSTSNAATTASPLLLSVPVIEQSLPPLPSSHLSRDDPIFPEDDAWDPLAWDINVLPPSQPGPETAQASDFAHSPASASSDELPAMLEPCHNESGDSEASATTPGPRFAAVRGFRNVRGRGESVSSIRSSASHSSSISRETSEAPSEQLKGGNPLDECARLMLSKDASVLEAFTSVRNLPIASALLHGFLPGLSPVGPELRCPQCDQKLDDIISEQTRRRSRSKSKEDDVDEEPLPTETDPIEAELMSIEADTSAAPSSARTSEKDKAARKRRRLAYSNHIRICAAQASLDNAWPQLQKFFKQNQKCPFCEQDADEAGSSSDDADLEMIAKFNIKPKKSKSKKKSRVGDKGYNASGWNAHVQALHTSNATLPCACGSKVHASMSILIAHLMTIHGIYAVSTSGKNRTVRELTKEQMPEPRFSFLDFRHHPDPAEWEFHCLERYTDAFGDVNSAKKWALSSDISYPEDQEPLIMKTLGASADGEQDIRYCGQTSSLADGSPLEWATCLFCAHDETKSWADRMCQQHPQRVRTHYCTHYTALWDQKIAEKSVAPAAPDSTAAEESVDSNGTSPSEPEESAAKSSRKRKGKASIKSGRRNKKQEREEQAAKRIAVDLSAADFGKMACPDPGCVKAGFAGDIFEWFDHLTFIHRVPAIAPGRGRKDTLYNKLSMNTIERVQEVCTKTSNIRASAQAADKRKAKKNRDETSEKPAKANSRSRKQNSSDTVDASDTAPPPSTESTNIVQAADE